MALCWWIQPTILLTKLNRTGRRNGVAALESLRGRPAPALPSPTILELQRLRVDDERRANFRAGSRNFRSWNAWTDEEVRCIFAFRKARESGLRRRLKLTRTLGYGTYRFQVRDVSHLEPSATLNANHLGRAFGTESNRRELALSWVAGDTLIMTTYIMLCSLLRSS